MKTVWIVVDTEGDIEMWAFKNEKAARTFMEEGCLLPDRYRLYELEVQS